MKKQFIVGMMVVTSAISFNAHAAGLGGAKSVREVLTEYIKEIKKVAFEGKTTAAELNAQQSKKAQDKLMSELNLSVAEKSSIRLIINASKDKKSEITNSLATVLAAKKMTDGKKDAESVSVAQAADAAVKLMSNAPLIGYKKDSSFLNTKDMADTTAALEKFVAMPDKYLTFEMKERDSYSKVILKLDEAVNKRPDTVEEAFVKAIMETQGVSKDKAMEIVRKLKDCV